MGTLDTDGACDLPPTAARARAGGSRRRSAGSLNGDQAKGDTSTADKQPSDFVVELGLLQSVYEQAINAGMWGKVGQQAAMDGQIPVLTIQLWNVSICPDCGSWITGQTCPMC